MLIAFFFNKLQAYFNFMFRINSKGVHPVITLHFLLRVEQEIVESSPLPIQDRETDIPQQVQTSHIPIIMLTAKNAANLFIEDGLLMKHGEGRNVVYLRNK